MEKPPRPVAKSAEQEAVNGDPEVGGRREGFGRVCSRRGSGSTVERETLLFVMALKKGRQGEMTKRPISLQDCEGAYMSSEGENVLALLGTIRQRLQDGRLGEAYQMAEKE